MFKKIKHILRNRRGDDLVSLSISIAMNTIIISSLGLVMANAFVFSSDNAKIAQESQDVRNIFGILSRYSQTSSNVATFTGTTGNTDIVFDDRTSISLTSSGCTGSGELRAQYIYDKNLADVAPIYLTSCRKDITMRAQPAFAGLEQRIMRLSVVVNGTKHATTLSAKN